LNLITLFLVTPLCNSEGDNIDKLERKQQVTILQLRTGHYCWKKHLKILGLCNSAICSCGLDEQMPQHYTEIVPSTDRPKGSLAQGHKIPCKTVGKRSRAMLLSCFSGKQQSSSAA
jgi:hypothetical protein